MKSLISFENTTILGGLSTGDVVDGDLIKIGVGVAQPRFEKPAVDKTPRPGDFVTGDVAGGVQISVTIEGDNTYITINDNDRYIVRQDTDGRKWVFIRGERVDITLSHDL